MLTFYLVMLHQSCILTDDLARQLRDLRLELGHNSTSERVDVISGNNDPVKSVAAARKNAVTSDSYFYQDALEHSQLLNRKYGPNTVYYIWCGLRWFEFSNFMSVKSIIRSLRPDTMVFLYDKYPVVDQWHYNTWMQELTQEYPFFKTVELVNKAFACRGEARPNMEYVKILLTDRGGFFVSEYAIVVDFPLELRKYDVIDAWDEDRLSGFYYTKKGLPGNRTFSDLLLERSLKTKKLTCLTDLNYPKANRKTACVIQTRPYFPKDIWNLENSFGRLVRSIFYGDPKILSPQPTNQNLIPNIAHVVWLGGGPMDFLFLLCILSLIHVAKVEAVYLHGDAPPTGAYWDLVKDDERLHLIQRDHPGGVYDQSINVVSHVTDVWRVDFMIKYGGIYVDTDTVFVKPLDHRIREYDAVASFDWTYWNHPFPDTINFGVSLGKRNAKYWHEFQKSMRWFIDSDWAWNGLRQPYKVMERHPDLVLIDPHLAVICYLSLCHPTWHQDYHNESVHHLNTNSIKDWRNDVFAFHWTLPTPYELGNQSALFSSNTMFADIAKFVLKKANLYTYFKNSASSNYVSNKMP